MAGELLLEVEPDLDNIWENACGQGHLAKVFDKAGKLGKATDLIDRGYGVGGIDFLEVVDKWENGDIVTNPPYKLSEEFIRHSLDLIDKGRKVCMFLKLQFLEGQGRKDLYNKYPPKVIYVCRGRIVCALNGEFTKIDKETGKEKKISSAIAYAWFVWEKGFKGEPVIRWIN